MNFDKLMCENTNIPTVDKSSGTVGKLGVTSSTLTRTNLVSEKPDKKSGSRFSEGKKRQRQEASSAPKVTIPGPTLNVVRPKKIFKNRNAESNRSDKNYGGSEVTKKTRTVIQKVSESSSENEDRVPEAKKLSITSLTPTRDPNKPRIILRIYKGKSQLINQPYSIQKPSQKIEVPESYNQINSIKPTKSLRRGHSQITNTDQEIEVSPSVIENPKKRRPHGSKLRVPPLKINKSRYRGEVKNEIAVKEPINMNIDKSKLEQLENDRVRLLAILENSADSETDVSVDNEEEKPDVTDDLSKQLELYFNPEKEHLSKKIEIKKGDVNVESKISSLKHRGVFIETEPIKTDDDNLTEKMEVEPAETITPANKSIFKSSNKRNKKGMVFSKHSWVHKEKNIDEEKKEEFELHFNPEKEHLSKKIDIKKGDVNVESKISSLKHRGVFVETEPIKTDDDDLTEKMEVEPAETIIPANKSIFKSSNKRNKKGMFFSKNSWVHKEKNIDEEKKEEFISNIIPSNSFEEKMLLKVTKSTDVFNDSMVVQIVKKTHQIQEFNDDVEFILSALQSKNTIGTRCMSAITLATKCMTPAFRMHVKAHGIVAKIFHELQDATKDQNLGICTALVMFVLSQDRLNMNLDSDCLVLMLNLFQNDISHNQALYACGLIDHQFQKIWEQVIQLCSKIKSQGAAKYLDTDNITVRQLTMETLFSLTSIQADGWFKEEMRQLGGLDHIVRAVIKCCNHVDSKTNFWSPTLLDHIKKVIPYLRILENVTIQNEENKVYLLDFENAILINTLVRIFKMCDYEIPLYPSYDKNDKDSIGAILRECLTANLKVLINLSHDSNQITRGSKIGQKDGIIDTTLHIFLKLPEYVPKDEQFDIMFLTIQLLINLVEINVENRKLIAAAKTPATKSFVIEALVKMFFQQEELARNKEKNTSKTLKSKKKQTKKTKKTAKGAPLKENTQFIEDTFALLIEKAGKNMRHTMIASYIAILFGYITMDNKEYLEFVGKQLPDGRFAGMLAVLDKYLNFMKLGAPPGFRGIKSVEIIIRHLTKCEKLQADDSGLPGTSA